MGTSAENVNVRAEVGTVLYRISLTTDISAPAVDLSVPSRRFTAPGSLISCFGPGIRRRRVSLAHPLVLVFVLEERGLIVLGF